jgi:hypothetical protein
VEQRADPRSRITSPTTAGPSTSQTPRQGGQTSSSASTAAHQAHTWSSMATYLVARLGVDALLTQSLDNTCGVAHMPTASYYYQVASLRITTLTFATPGQRWPNGRGDPLAYSPWRSTISPPRAIPRVERRVRVDATPPPTSSTSFGYAGLRALRHASRLPQHSTSSLVGQWSEPTTAAGARP